MARAEPDGYTLILGTNQTHATNQSLIKSWTVRRGEGFRAGRGRRRDAACAGGAQGFRGAQPRRVVALAKAKPGALTFGSMGNGSGAHLAGELFKTKAGIDMLHVPYKGLAPMTTELLAGRIDLSIAPLPGLIAQQIASGNVRALGIASAGARRSLTACRRSPKPASPASRPTPGRRCLRRRRRRRAVIEQLYKAVAAAMAKESVRANLARQGLPVALKTPAEMSAMLPGEVEKWAAVIKLANVTVE